MNPPKPTIGHLQDSAGWHRSDPRTREAGFYPGFSHGRGIAPISTIAITQSSVTLNNGDLAKAELFTNAPSKNLILVSNEVALYIGSVDPLNLLPQIFVGGTQDMSKWQFYGPVNALVSTTLSGGSPGVGQNAYQLVVRNISAGTVTLIFQARSKFIINYGGVGA